MFSIANLYNSACSNAVNPIRIHPIMMSIIIHHYKILKECTTSFDEFDNSSNDHNNDIYDYHNIDSTILKKEIDKWYNFSFVLRKKNRMLFEEIIIQIFIFNKCKRKRKFYRIILNVFNI